MASRAGAAKSPKSPVPVAVPLAESVDPRHVWLRLADPGWANPLDPTFAPVVGGRWTPVGGPPTLYFNADVATARANVRRLCAGYSIVPEDLDDDNGYTLVGARLPPRQRVADAHSTDAHSTAGLAALGLPPTYPLDRGGTEIAHRTCRSLGQRIFDAGLDGVHCRSAATHDGSGRELGWFPRPGAHARRRDIRRFGDWFY